MGSKCEYFCTGKWESPAKHFPVWGNGKYGRNQQEQCIVWIPLQCGVPMAKRANNYSAAMVMTCKTGESPSNGAAKSGHPFQNVSELKTFAL